MAAEYGPAESRELTRLINTPNLTEAQIARMIELNRLRRDAYRAQREAQQ